MFPNVIASQGDTGRLSIPVDSSFSSCLWKIVFDSVWMLFRWEEKKRKEVEKEAESRNRSWDVAMQCFGPLAQPCSARPVSGASPIATGGCSLSPLRIARLCWAPLWANFVATGL